MPASVSPPPAAGLNVTVARPDQMGIIASLAHDIWNRYYPSIISKAQIDYMLRQRYSPDALAERSAARGTTLLIAWLGPLALGFAVLSVPEDAPDEANLDAFYLHPDHHRRGLGTVFMEQVVAHLDGQPRQILVLNVNRKNITAINFYFRQGFTIRSAVDVNLGGGFTGDDFIMERPLP
ncbi:MAG: GNAT family N-acetyltransferase [Planctomycetes bacterium]|nr:GNAT family N-acetyltransferase [Planctomycetota bacterium]